MEKLLIRIGIAGFVLGLMVFMAFPPARSQAPPPGKAVILEFRRPLCPVCAKMEGILKEVERRYGGQVAVRFLHLDADEALFKQYRVTFVPTQVFLDSSGREVFRHEGLFPLADLVGKLQELGLVKD